MAYKTEIISKAFSVKENAVKNAEYIYEKALRKAEKEYPRIAEINSQLTMLSGTLIGLTMRNDTRGIEECSEKIDLLNSEKNALLEKAGVKEKQVFCPVCSDTGYVSGKLCNCIKTIAKEIALKEMNDIMPLDSFGFDKFRTDYYSDGAKEKMTGIFEYCKNYAENFSLSSPNLLFIGKSGLGKTHLSLSIVKEVTEKGYNVVYGPAQTLFTAAEKEHFSYSGTSDNLDNMINADLLVIDDLGTEFITNFVQSLFYNIVNTRLLKKLPTIISTNLSGQELEDRYTARMTSRLAGEYLTKNFIGSDIRLIKKLDK